MDGNADDAASLGQHLDVTDVDDRLNNDEFDRRDHAGRTWLGVYYECCASYSRVYRRPDETQYRGRCPECGASVSIRVGPNGVAARMLIATPI